MSCAELPKLSSALTRKTWSVIAPFCTSVLSGSPSKDRPSIWSHVVLGRRLPAASSRDRVRLLVNPLSGSMKVVSGMVNRKICPSFARIVPI